MQSSRLQGTGFPKVPNQGPSSAIFPLLFPSRRRNQFVITLCMPQCSRQPYNLQLWGLLGVRRWGRDGGEGHWFEERREGVKKEKKYHRKLPRLKREKKALSLLSYLSSSAHQRHKCLIFSLSLTHSSEMRSFSVTLVPLLPPSLYLCASIRQKHFDKVKHEPIVLGEKRRGGGQNESTHSANFWLTIRAIDECGCQRRDN